MINRLFGRKDSKETKNTEGTGSVVDTGVATGMPGEITPAEVRKLLDEGRGLQIVDVREPQEYAEARVDGSALIPLGQLSGRIGELRKDQPVVAMCRSGNRSSVAVSMLKRAGFSEVSNLKGGILAWTKSGLPVKRGR